MDESTPLITQRPFRSPHHTVSPVALVGGGSIPRPGEVSLANGGVLFLDEFAEFPKQALEVLRQPLEDKKVTISRVNATYTYPASFMLLAGMNPCPCGYRGDPRHSCKCSSSDIQRYTKKISGPLLDRIDIVAHVNVEKYEFLSRRNDAAESSEKIRSRVDRARKIQLKRMEGSTFVSNSQISAKEIEIYCPLGREENRIMKAAFEAYAMSARTYHRVLKLSRTIADLAGEENINCEHIAEALQYRGSFSTL